MLAIPPAAARLDVAISDRLADGEACALWQEAATASVFNHPAWWRAAIAAFGQDRPLLVARATRADGTLAGLWPFWRKRLGARDAFAAVLEPVGARHTDYVLPVLHRDADAAEVTAAMLGALAARLDARTLLSWPKAPQGAASDEAIADLGGRRDLLHHCVTRNCAAIRLAATVAAQEKAWSKRLRGDVRRQIRRLEAIGSVELAVLRQRAEITAGAGRLVAMHRHNWISRQGHSELEDPANIAFLESVARDLPLERLHYSELRVGGTAISCHLGFRHDAAIQWYKPAFAYDWRAYSPGKLHLALASHAAITEGMREIDLMQGEEPYKSEWADRSTTTRSHLIAGRLAYPLWVWNARLRRHALQYRT